MLIVPQDKDPKDAHDIKMITYGALSVMGAYAAVLVLNSCNLTSLRSLASLVLEFRAAWRSSSAPQAQQPMPPSEIAPGPQIMRYDMPENPPPPAVEPITSAMTFAKPYLEPGIARPLSNDDAEYYASTMSRLMEDGSPVRDDPEPWPVN